MCILICAKYVLSTIPKHRFIQQHAVFSQSACLSLKVRCNRTLLRGQVSAPLGLYRQCHLQFACLTATKRYYSKYDCVDSKGSAGEIQGETAEIESSINNDTDHNIKSLEGFTIDVLVSLLRQENAVDICVIKVPDEIKYSDYFIVVSGISPRHLRAMALYAIKVYKFMKRAADPLVKIEGKDTEDWMCIDFGTMVIHFMMPETRALFELEKLWTLRSYDEQLRRIPPETLPEDFMYGIEKTSE